MRYIKIKKFCELTGYTDQAVRTKLNHGVWLEGFQYRRRNGEVFIDIVGVEQWVEGLDRPKKKD